MNAAVKKHNNGVFVNVMVYHARYFEASAWMVLGVDRFTRAKEEGKDMGIAAGTAQAALDIFTAVGGIVNTLPQDYKGTYANKLKQAQSLAAQSADKAKTVFFEKIAPTSQCSMPDAKNFVKYD